MNKEQSEITSYLKQRQAKTAEAFTNIERFLKHSTDGQSPFELLHNLLVHDAEDVSEGTNVMVRLTEDLIRFFMQPANATAFQCSAITSPQELASVLVQLHWVFEEMDRPVAMAHLDKFNLEHYANEDEITSITRKYRKLAEIEEAKATISGRYQEAA